MNTISSHPSLEHGTKTKIWLAPMEGVVDHIMRDLLTATGGYDACVTEFMRVTDLVMPNKVFLKYCPELLSGSRTPAGTPVYFQLLGGQPEPLAGNAAKAAALGAFGIDLNFGCPAKTVNRHDGGATLLKFPNRIFDIVGAVRREVPPEKTVSAKLRLGFSDKSLFLENAIAAQEGGASWITIHARTRDEGYRPPAHWEYICKIRERVTIPVIANGEIWSAEDAAECLKVSGCRDLMVGRGAVANPWLPNQIQTQIEPGQPRLGPTWEALQPILVSFFKKCSMDRGPHYAVNRSKQWTRFLSRNFLEAKHLFENIKILEDPNQIEQLIRQTESL